MKGYTWYCLYVNGELTRVDQCTNSEKMPKVEDIYPCILHSQKNELKEVKIIQQGSNKALLIPLSLGE